MMYDKSDVRFVDAHTECYGGNNNLDVVVHPPLLDDLSLLVVEISVIKITFDLMILFQSLYKLFAFLSCNTINYTAHFLEFCGKQISYVMFNTRNIIFFTYLV